MKRSAPLAAVLVLSLAAAASAASAQHQYSASGKWLELDGSADTSLKSANPQGAQLVMLAGPATLGARLTQWVQQTLAGGSEKKSGALLSLDFDKKVKARIEFHDSLIAAVALPALDASSKDPGYLRVTLAAEKVVHKKGDGAAVKTSVIQKHWSPSNFRLRIDGLDDEALNRVTKIGAITVRRVTGRGRDSAGLAVSNLAVTFNAAHAASVSQWLQATKAAHGGDASAQVKNGTLELLDSKLQPILTFELSGLRILSAAKASVDRGQISTLKTVIKCAGVKLD